MVLKKIRANLSDALDIPQDVLLDVPKITVLGETKIWVENHSGLLECDTDKIKMNTSLGTITVFGRGFILVKLLPTELAAEGHIDRIEFGGE